MSLNPRSSKRSRWIDIMFIVAILSLSSLIAFLLWIPNSSKKQENNITANQPIRAAEEVNEKASVYPGIRIITETSNDVFTPFAIQYPQSDVPSFNKIVKEYTQNFKTLYLDETKYFGETKKHTKSELNISFEVFQNTTGDYSFVIHSKMYTRGANGISETKIIHLHNQSGHMLTIEDLLAKNEKSLEILSTRVRNAITSNKQLSPYLLLNQFEVKTAPKWGNFTNFVLNTNSIDFYYSNYEIASGAAGEPIISIPLSDLNDILADEYKLPTGTVDTKPIGKVPEKEEPVATETPKEEAIKIPANGKVVALTFDDGPNPVTTRKILDTLKKYNAKATFFMLGSRVSFYPDVVKEIKEAGHELGNHTWTHSDLTKASVEKIASEINNTSDAIEKATGSKPTVFRPPYGAVNKTVRSQTSLPVILWDVDTLDWKYKDAKHLLEHVKTHVKDGSIVLMHDIHSSTADGLDAVLAYLQGEGYTFVTVSELKK
ncbi:polysaccharide deacetylase family protein [Psychrobacillus sp. L4]|uniref:polysaccharide deacetylase family protein n=1 Tax=Psychrobacillus sp. L4 TaxID=3236892 RepID=UPI0036F234CB